MSELTFPPGFLWGAATAAHQVEGNNDNCDWWDWEIAAHRPAPMAEPSGVACEHWTRYRQDIKLLADLGLNSYRFSVEWARIEPADGNFSREALDHYLDMVRACLELKVVPIITLQHFTLPRWVAARGGWSDPGFPALFARYARTVAAALRDQVPYYCTINEPGNMVPRGYLGTFPAPPFVRDKALFKRAVSGVITAHRLARREIKEIHPDARVGMAHALQEWVANRGGELVMQYIRFLHEDIFFEEVEGDDFLGVQTYTRLPVEFPAFLRPITRLILQYPPLRDAVVVGGIRQRARQMEKMARKPSAGKARLTQMGYEWAPEAVEATVRRVAGLFPGKEILITEHGIGTENDAERIEFITAGLQAIHRLIRDGIPVTGYLHWSLLDNWEWWDGYRPKFGLVAVDRGTQERIIKLSAHWYGELARQNTLTIK